MLDRIKIEPEGVKMYRQLWNENWKCWVEKDAFALSWEVPQDAQEISLPHDAMILEKPKKDSPNGSNTGGRDGCNLIYAKSLFVSKEELSHHYLLEFDGVYMNAYVYVNGQLAAHHPNGYSVFYVEPDDYLKAGENEIRVIVRAGAMPNSRWYSGAGIYRDVWLLCSKELVLMPDRVQVTTEDLDDEGAIIRIDSVLRSLDRHPSEVSLETEIKDSENKTIIMEHSRLSLLPGEERKVSRRIFLQKPACWSFESPSLYRLTLRILTQDKEIIEEHEERFGIRTIRVDAVRGLRVNGKTVKLRGSCIHHDHGLLGAAEYRDAEMRRIAKLKEAGFNAIRMAHHPAAKVLLEVCDELGMYVMDEAFDMWCRSKSGFDYGMFFPDWWEKDLTAMVRNDYNHPSVSFYPVGNEISEIGSPQGSRLCGQLSEKLHSLDPTRFTLAAVNGAFTAGEHIAEITKELTAGERDGEIEGNVNDFMALMGRYMDRIVEHRYIGENLERVDAMTDISGYNYMANRYVKDRETYPHRVIVGSETCPPEIGKDWPVILKYPHLLGDFTWTGWDYLGEAGGGVPRYAEETVEHTAPAQISYVGDLDITGYRRPASYYREIVFGFHRDPYIAVQPPRHFGHFMIPWPWTMTDGIASWSWEGSEGQPVRIEVYADCEELKLYQDGRLLQKKTAEDCDLPCRFLFETVYCPGELTAVAYKEGKEWGRSRLCSVTKKVQLCLREDLPEGLKRTGEAGELVFLAIELRDEKGTLIMNQDRVLRADIGSGAELMGFGSADPFSEYGYQQTETRTFEGRALLILKRLSTKPVQVSIDAQEGLKVQWQG